MPGVTISSGFGAGGSVVAPAVAKELGFDMIDRAISATVAARLQVTVAEAEDGSTKQTFGSRFLQLLAPLGGGVLGVGSGAAPGPDRFDEDDATAFRIHAEDLMHTAMADGAVVLGRAGACAFLSSRDVLRVRLFGDPELRIAQAARIEGLSEQQARDLIAKADRARDHYVRKLYKVSVNDPSLFHLQLDSTVLGLDTCVQLIVDAYRAIQPVSPVN